MLIFIIKPVTYSAFSAKADLISNKIIILTTVTDSFKSIPAGLKK